jgi:hypothetical protein
MLTACAEPYKLSRTKLRKAQRMDSWTEGRIRMKMLGIVLIVVGLIALAYQGFSYTTTEKVVDLGPLEVTKENKETIPLPPVLGGLALAGGIVLVIASGKR